MTDPVNSGASTATSNGVINLSVPTDLLGTSGSTLNFNYDFGPSAAAMASSAYAFIQSSYAIDQGFVGQTISGSQDFLAHQSAPIMAQIQATGQQMSSLLPGLFTGLQSASQSAQANQLAISQNAIAAQQSTAAASINANQQIASNSGGCYITTAVCENIGLPDDCGILQYLRQFRDDVLMPQNPALVELYYARAPELVAAIELRPDKERIYDVLFCDFILPAAVAVAEGQNNAAFCYYFAGLKFAQMVAS